MISNHPVDSQLRLAPSQHQIGEVLGGLADGYSDVKLLIYDATSRLQ